VSKYTYQTKYLFLVYISQEENVNNYHGLTLATTSHLDVRLCFLASLLFLHIWRRNSDIHSHSVKP